MALSTVQTAKLHLVALTGLSKDALHIYVGLAVWLIAAMLFRKSVKTLVPLLAVLAVAAIGEAFDAWDDFSSLGHWRVQASVHDVLNTMFWPTILCLLVRYTKVVR
jgi:uncharacterized membrane protein YqgA involved in biofilm formation